MLEVTALAVGVLQAAEKEDWELAWSRIELIAEYSKREGNPAIGFAYAIGVILRYALFRASRTMPGGPFAGYTWPIPMLPGLGIGAISAIIQNVEGAGIPGARKRKKYK